jgi:FAD/FMN-containing dehydrogenase
VLRFQLAYRDLASLTADQNLVLADNRFDQLQGSVVPDGARGWRYQLEAAAFYDEGKAPDERGLLAGVSDDRDAAMSSDLAYREDADAFAKLEDVLRSNGQWFTPHPWWLTFLRGSNGERVAAAILRELTPEDIGPFGRVAYYPLRTSALRAPLVRMPDEGIAFVFNIIRFPPSADAVEVERMIASNRALYDRVRELGGVLYPVGALPMCAADWKDHFGSAWPRFFEAKERYDPCHTLSPGYNVF